MEEVSSAQNILAIHIHLHLLLYTQFLAPHDLIIHMCECVIQLISSMNYVLIKTHLDLIALSRYSSASSSLSESYKDIQNRKGQEAGEGRKEKKKGETSSLQLLN